MTGHRIPDIPDTRPRGDGKGALSLGGDASHMLKIPARVDIASWHGKSAPERRWIVDNLIPERAVTMLAGDGGVGKTLLALQLVGACTVGRAWLGRPTRACKAIGVFCEDDEEELWRRLESVARHYGASVSDLAEHLQLFSRVGQDNLIMAWPNAFAAGDVQPFFTQLSNLAVDSGAELIALDALHDFFGGNENSRPQARQFIGELRALAMHIRGAVLLTAHPSLSGRNTGSGEAGSTAWNAAVRQRLYLTTPRGEDDQDEPLNGLRELKTMKANYTAAGDRIKLHWHEGVFVVDDEPQGIFGTIERRSAEQAFLDCLDALEKRGFRVNAVRNQPNFAPRQMLGMSAAKGFTHADLELAMKRALEAGKIRVVEDGPPSRRRSYLARVPSQEGAE